MTDYTMAKKDKKTNKYRQNTTLKTKDLGTRVLHG